MFLVALALCTLPAPAACSEWQTVFLDQTVTSLSGAWSLRSEPHVKNGYRGAEYRLSAKQSDGSARLVWEGRREFTLRDPIVDERGWVYGWAVVRPATAAPNEAGTLRIIALDPLGTVKLEDRVTQHVQAVGCTMPGPSASSAVDPYPSSPRIAGLMRVPSADRLIVRVDQRSESEEEWWVYDPVAGKRRAQFVPFPGERMRTSSRIRFTLLVTGAPLVLAHATCIDWNSSSAEDEGFRESWALFDLDGQRVWSLDDVDNPRIADYYAWVKWERALTNRLASSTACRFSFFMSRTGETVTKQVRAGDDGKWIVEDAPLEPVK